MKRTTFPLIITWVLACGPADADDAGRPPAGSMDAALGATVAAPGAPSTGAPSDTRPRVVFLGTSLTAGYGLEPGQGRFTDLVQAMADSAAIPVRVVNAGVSGDTSAGGLRRLDWVLQERADVLVVELGANDGLRGQSVEAMKENLERVIVEARRRYPGVRIVLAGMEAPPNMGERYTSAFREAFLDLAREHDTVLVPFLLEGVAGVRALNQSDGIHPTVEGHRRIAQLLWPLLEPVLREVAAAEVASP